MLKTKTCEYCGKEFSKKINCSKKSWAKQRFCSKSCAEKGKDHSHLKKYSFKKGIQNNPNGGFKKGMKPHNYKKTGYGYTAIHKWLSYHYKKTGICEGCGKNTNIDPQKKRRKRPRTQWANVSGKYLRDRKDFKELCLSCHSKMHSDIKHDPWFKMPA